MNKLIADVKKLYVRISKDLELIISFIKKKCVLQFVLSTTPPPPSRHLAALLFLIMDKKL